MVVTEKPRRPAPWGLGHGRQMLRAMGARKETMGRAAFRPESPTARSRPLPAATGAGQVAYRSQRNTGVSHGRAGQLPTQPSPARPGVDE